MRDGDRKRGYEFRDGFVLVPIRETPDGIGFVLEHVRFEREVRLLKERDGFPIHDGYWNSDFRQALDVLILRNRRVR